MCGEEIASTNEYSKTIRKKMGKRRKSNQSRRYRTRKSENRETQRRRHSKNGNATREKKNKLELRSISNDRRKNQTKGRFKLPSAKVLGKEILNTRR
jgi:hypothetical protein